MALILGDDDERVMEAALSFIDEFEHSAETDGKGASTRWPITEEKAKKRAEINARKRLLRKAGVYGDPNRARNAQTREIAFLREQLEKLTLDLQVLQHQQSQCSGVIVATNASSSQIPSMWQKLAQRQRLRREEAEANNLRLRLSLERHRKIADDLCNLARKRALQLANEYEWIMDIGHFSHPNHHIVRALNFSAGSSEFLELFQHLAAAYQDMDTIFEGNGLASMGISLDDVHMRESTKDKYRYLEFFSNNVLPFELHATTEATWDYFRGVEKHLGYGNLYEKAAKDLDEPYTIIEDFTKELDQAQAPG
ncbi:M96 mating-specific protein family [Phytophthora cinnamomi]|uniref:M96 mating-specific protein family n=1 Tax=Phytophthora cinnamomi TaxID=4785 RepID=UPI00355AC8E4|nr:M96 mating-specific protein family [Phytophthora cinnamomi]